MAYNNDRNGKGGGNYFNGGRGNDRRTDGERSDKPRYGDDKPRYGEKKSFGDKPRYGDDKPRYGEKKSFGDKPRYGDDKPRYGEKKSFGDKPRYGDDKPRYSEKKSFGDKPRYGDSKPRYGENKQFGDKPRYSEDKPRYGEDKPRYGERKSFDDKPRYGEDKPRYGGDKPRYGEKRSFDDKPRYSEDKPRYGNDKPRFGDKPAYDSRRPERKERDTGVEAVKEAVSTNAEDELPYIVMGRNAVREALKSGRSIDRILVVKDPDGALRELVSLARDNNILLREVDRKKLDEMCMPFGHGGKPGNHQGIVAQVPGVDYCDISDILDVAKERNEKPFIIILDGIEDPHNLGSIIRSAVCAGAHGVIIPKRRSASVTAAACKASAGAVDRMKVAKVSNISGAIARLKDEGMWIAGADMTGTPMREAKLEGAIALVIGGEGDGISRLVRENCDFMVSIPMYGEMDSLNASVAAAVLMFEKKRKDECVK